MKAHFILYVADQGRSTDFYRTVLEQEPSLEAPGMTEFMLGPDTVLGLMPVAGAARLLGQSIINPEHELATARDEVYLIVEDPAAYHLRALAAGARELSSLAARDWGHEAAYSMDADGHVLAFAKVI